MGEYHNKTLFQFVTFPGNGKIFVKRLDENARVRYFFEYAASPFLFIKLYFIKRAKIEIRQKAVKT